MNFDGIWTPVVTPFNSDGSLKLEALDELLNTLIEQGVHGLIIGGTTGEYYAQSMDECKRLFDRVIEHVQGRIPLMAGINATATADSLELGQHAKNSGFDALLVAAPYYCQPAQDELLAHIRAIDDAFDMPVMLYNFPDRTGVPMTMALIEALRDRPNIQAIKESTGSIERLHTLATDHADQLQLSCGMDDQVLEFFVWGARSWVAGASNFLAPEHVALHKACVIDKDFVTGRELAARLLPMLNLLEQGGKFCQYIKYGCELAGLPVGPARRPLLPLNEQEKAVFKQVYDALVACRS
ncbi:MULTISPECIES: dihydrodipicolinate synthase family protein [Halomonadaceae]|uniref:4-hydroxy-tetrahydrodipicolinate synthase n=1 Tax=Vreelandella titanicae TaxID=664683 RepID=A0AAP9NRQ5_9GAMM|nr:MULTISPECIES: dihydrodipicolinate synthase family protein [Halomonas]QKS25867.1 4-hydroxy-tetrahydrodipicolinate synthase [Halomonas titanicae]CDG52936.1 Dihydrodipicolinate synthetase family protein [Halomonas sp. A3H3]SDI78908.1 4-hydroxy-tetrahydrodipicolinate synthase [Halomonas titanicae]